jgi:lipopolysaccharide assembly protein A
MNIFRLIVALVFLAAGLIIGFLNDSPAITLDLVFFRWATTPGNAIILSLLTGVVVGGSIVFATLVLPLYAKLRRAARTQASAPVSPPPAGG